jgi:hypothetical protein
VRPLNSSGTDAHELDVLLTALLRAARGQGHEPQEVLHRLEQMVLPRDYKRVAVIETDPGMGEVLQTEIGEHVLIRVDAIEISCLSSIPTSGACLAVALPTRAAAVRERLPRGIPFMALRIRSVRGSLAENTRPSPNAIVSIVSASQDFRHWARAVLIAVGLDPECLCDVDTTVPDWRERANAGELVITDVVAARQLPVGCQAKVFRVIADSCLAEMKQLCAS